MQNKYLMVIILVLLSIHGWSLLKPKQTVYACDDTHSQLILVPYGRVTTVNFPESPKDVIPGETGFDFKKVRSDLVIKALRPGAKTNLLVYLEGRRCSFHLESHPFGDEFILVRDPKEKTFEVKFHD